MVTAQRTVYLENPNIINGHNEKYGRKNWANDRRPRVTKNAISGSGIFGVEPYVQTRHVVKLTKRAFIMIAFVMCGLISIVCLSAYTSGIRFQINGVDKECRAIQAEIDEMNIILESDKSISKLEERALNELGMKYPDPAEVVYLQHKTDVKVAEN